MRIRAALVVALIAGTGVACGDGSTVSPYCRKLIAANDRLTSAQGDLYRGGSAGRTALSRIVGELRGLQPGAPAEIRTALAGLVAAFQQAEQLIQHPTKQSGQRLAKVAATLSADGKKVNDYAASKCK